LKRSITGGASINFAAHQRRVKLSASIGRNEARLFKSKNIGEHAAFIVRNKSNGLAPDPTSGGGAEFFYAA
jgi:hypothetical protein